jgi:hypothetical protein
LAATALTTSERLRPRANQKCAKEFEEKSQKGTWLVDAIVSQLGLGARHHTLNSLVSIFLLLGFVSPVWLQYALHMPSERARKRCSTESGFNAQCIDPSVPILEETNPWYLKDIQDVLELQ